MSMPPLTAEAARALRRANWLRLLLGHRIVNGLSVGFGLAVLTVPVFWLFGPVIAASASVGMLVTSIGDQTAPARGKLRQIAPLLFLAAPMSLAVQMAHLAPSHSTLLIGALVCIGGFIGMLGTAWGVRGGPLGFALLLTIIFAMSTPPPSEWQAVIEHALWFELGALLYAAYAVLSAKVLNLRFRTLALADALNELATMLRQQGTRLASTGDRRENQLRALLSEQAVLADKLQVARDLVLDVPKTPRELRLAGMLISAIRLREHALACELEIDMQQSRGSTPITLAQAQALEALWREVGDQIDQVCWALFTVRRSLSLAAEPTVAVSDDADIPPALQAAVHSIREETRSLWRLTASTGPESMSHLVERARDWPRFRTSMRWPIAPLKRALSSGHQPVLRYAARVAIALGVGYTIALHLPWAAHPHWILLTIAVVMRNNIAQTLERRNARLIGTLLGCVLVTIVLSLHPSVPVLFMLMALGAGIAHGFAQVRYLVAATAATVLALIQGQLLHTSGEFALLERLADTFIGTALAWAFSYVLPAWERRQLPALLTRLRNAQIAHASVALSGAELSVANADWRLARREVHDSLAAIANAAQRARSEPVAVQPPLELLERLQLRSYRLLAQLGGVRTWREQPQALAPEVAEPLLTRSLERIKGALQSTAPSVPSMTSTMPIEALTETISAHEEASLLRQRLRDAADEARALGADLSAADAWEAARHVEDK